MRLVANVRGGNPGAVPVPDKTHILFLCTGNSCRSQMAEGWARTLGGTALVAESAGIEAHGKNPRAIAVMAEAGVDISGQESTVVSEAMLRRADILVTVCGHADEMCPALPATVRKVHWPLDDPARATGTEEEIMAAFRATRDEVERRVRVLLTNPSPQIHIEKSPDPPAGSHEPVAMPFFERYLSLWVALCIVAGIAMGQFIPAVFGTLGAWEVARVNLPVALLIWLMILPMLLKIDFHSLQEVRKHLKGVGVTLLVNWAIKPFSMALLAWFFVRHLFSGWLPADQLDSYIAGLILLAAAPCTAMVFVWSNLSGGHPGFTLSQVALNDVIMVFAFAPIVALLLGIASITIPWETLLLSVVLYIVLPVVVAALWRRRLVHGSGGEARLQRVLERMHPVSLAALLLTLVLLFGFQGGQILTRPVIILLLAVPILIQVYFNSGLAYLLNRKLGVAHCVAGPSALIGASNFFELAVAAAISLFGLESGAALATVVGVLVEVPVMLTVVWIVNRSKHWYEAAAS